MKDFMERIDAIFYGRKSYEMAGGNIFPQKKAYVFSSSLKKLGENEVMIKGDVSMEVEKIKREEGKDIWLFGGASPRPLLATREKWLPE